MKNKLRKLHLNQEVYFYSISERYQQGTSPDKSGQRLTKIRFFKEGCKNTPLEINFLAQEAYILGNPLTHHNPDPEKYKQLNLHQPSLLKKILILVLEMGWEAEMASSITVNGLSLLETV